MRPWAQPTSRLHSIDHYPSQVCSIRGIMHSVYFYASTLYVRAVYDYIFFVQGKAGGVNW